jgi:hypothetical protein
MLVGQDGHGKGRDNFALLYLFGQTIHLESEREYLLALLAVSLVRN